MLPSRPLVPTEQLGREGAGAHVFPSWVVLAPEGGVLIPQARPSLVSSTHTRHQETQTQSKNAARPSRKPILALNSVNFLVPRTDELWGVKICRVVTSNAFVPCEFTDPGLSLLKLCCGEGCFPTKSLGAVDFAGLWSPGSFNSSLG